MGWGLAVQAVRVRARRALMVAGVRVGVMVSPWVLCFILVPVGWVCTEKPAAPTGVVVAAG